MKRYEAQQLDDRFRADADHLKTPADVDITAAAGFTFYTIDPSDYVDGNADDYSESTLRDRFASIHDSAPWFDSYLNRRMPLANGRSFTIDEQAAMRCREIRSAIAHAIDLAKYIQTVNDAAGRTYELESVSMKPANRHRSLNITSSPISSASKGRSSSASPQNSWANSKGRRLQRRHPRIRAVS